MDTDLNRYDLNHVTTGHPRMSRAEWERAYRLAWKRYYTLDHIETILRRAAANRAERIRVSPSNLMFLITWFKGCIGIEGLHPLEGGGVRLKFRRDRRHGMPVEPAWRFYPRYGAETVVKVARWGSLYARLWLIYAKVARDPERHRYTDAAMTPVTEHDAEERELFQARGAQDYLGQQRRLDEIRRGESLAPERPAA